MRYFMLIKRLNLIYFFLYVKIVKIVIKMKVGE